MLTIRKAAELYYVDESTIWKAVNTGKIPTKQMTNINDRGRPVILLKESEVENWNKNRKRPFDRDVKISIYQGCELTGIAYSTVQKAVDQGEIPATKTPYKDKFKWQLDRESFMEWAKTKPSRVKQVPDPTNIPKCNLAVGQKVRYNMNHDGRAAEKMVRGEIIDKTNHLIVVANDIGFVECFSHFDYKQGAFKRV